MPYGNMLSRSITSLLLSVYNFIYRPDDIARTFASFDKYVWEVYENSSFESVFLLIQTIGIGLLTVAFIISLMDKTSSGDFTLNNFFRHVLKYVMLYMVVLNCMTILEVLLDATTSIFETMNSQFKLQVSISKGNYISKRFMAEGIKQFIGTGEKLAMFIMLLLPYIISCLFNIIVCFFASSRLIEIVLRVSLAPISVGMSFFGSGANLDIVRYLKRTMGIFFQIVVVLLISTSLCFVHSSLITTSKDSNQSSTVIKNPALDLEIDPDVCVYYYTADNRKYEKTDEANANRTLHLYTEDSIRNFTASVLDPENYFLSTGIMLSAIFMLFKSRSISTQLFG